MANLRSTTTSWRRTLQIATLVLLASALGACHGDPFSPYWDGGTYALRYANNQVVPAIVSGGYGANAQRTEVTRGMLSLRRDHSYQLLVEVRDWDAGRAYESTVVFAGRYENDGRVLYLDYYSPGDGFPRTMVANWRDGRIEVVVPGVDGRYGVLCLFED